MLGLTLCRLKITGALLRLGGRVRAPFRGAFVVLVTSGGMPPIATARAWSVAVFLVLRMAMATAQSLLLIQIRPRVGSAHRAFISARLVAARIRSPLLF